MTSGQEDTYSNDLTALTDYEPQTIQTAPPTVGVGGGRLNTPPPPPTSMSPGIGVGTTNTSPSILSNVTIGVGGTRTLQQQAGRPATPTGQGYLDDRSTVGYKRPGKGKQPLTKRPTKGAKEPRTYCESKHTVFPQRCRKFETKQCKRKRQWKKRK